MIITCTKTDTSIIDALPDLKLLSILEGDGLTVFSPPRPTGGGGLAMDQICVFKLVPDVDEDYYIVCCDSETQTAIEEDPSDQFTFSAEDSLQVDSTDYVSIRKFIAERVNAKA